MWALLFLRLKISVQINFSAPSENTTEGEGGDVELLLLIAPEHRLFPSSDLVWTYGVTKSFYKRMRVCCARILSKYRQSF